MSNKIHTIPQAAVDGEHTYNALAFTTHSASDGELTIVLTTITKSDRTMIVSLSFDDLRKLSELTEKDE